MSDKKNQLFRILQQAGTTMTGKQLAEALGVSSRTVISYIKEINSQHPTPIILSSQEGYSLNSTANFTAENMNIDLPQDRQQRFLYLLKLLLLSQKDGVDAFDLADEMMVSYSLLKKEIISFNDALKAFHISIVSRNNIISIEGKERDKRRVMSAFIRKEQQGSLLNLAQLQEYFGEEMIRRISEIIRNEAHKGNSSINDFSLLNLLLHLSIITNRLLLGQSLIDNHSTAIELHESSGAEQIAYNIIDAVQKEFGITLNSVEHAQMSSLIQAHIHIIGDQTANPAEELRENELFQFLTYVMDEIKHTFYLDFTNLAFLVPFTLHISNLLIRLGNNILIENPVKDTFRNSSAFLYDVAVEIMYQVSSHYHIQDTISDDEFSFIVMHLALEMERQRADEASVRCLLYLPKYLNVEKDIPSKLNSRFENSMEIIAVVNVEEDIRHYDYDMLVSFVNVAQVSTKKFIRISPLLNRSDYAKLDDAITGISQAKMLENLKTDFAFFFDEGNFFFCEKDMEQYQVIHLLCENLVRGGYVGEEFEERVITREKAISTAYTSFAVPHAVSQSVANQCVSVFISPKGIQWDDKRVNCVMLMAVDPHGLNEFQTMYNALVVLLLETDCVARLKKCDTFDEFRTVILNCNL